MPAARRRCADTARVGAVIFTTLLPYYRHQEKSSATVPSTSRRAAEKSTKSWPHRPASSPAHKRSRMKIAIPGKEAATRGPFSLASTARRCASFAYEHASATTCRLHQPAMVARRLRECRRHEAGALDESSRHRGVAAGSPSWRRLSPLQLARAAPGISSAQGRAWYIIRRLFFV